jgi:hypothetical protein
MHKVGDLVTLVFEDYCNLEVGEIGIVVHSDVIITENMINVYVPSTGKSWRFRGCEWVPVHKYNKEIK